jgi:hypothetical protein
MAFVFLMIVAAPDSTQAAASEPTASEPRIKAALLYKFIFYAEWPPEALPPSEPLSIGVFADDEVFDELRRITAGREVNGRYIVVKKMGAGESLSDVHLLFVGATDKRRQEVLLKDAQRHPILTVTETEDGLHLGSVINFRVVDDRVRFEISLPAAERNSLKLSSRMLALALQVTKAEPR